MGLHPHPEVREEDGEEGQHPEVPVHPSPPPSGRGRRSHHQGGMTS